MRVMHQNNAWLLRYIVPLIARQSIEACYFHCSALVERFAQGGCEACLEAMTDLAPVIGRLQSPEDVSKILKAISAVSHWWP